MSGRLHCAVLIGKPAGFGSHWGCPYIMMAILIEKIDDKPQGIGVPPLRNNLIDRIFASCHDQAFKEKMPKESTKMNNSETPKQIEQIAGHSRVPCGEGRSTCVAGSSLMFGFKLWTSRLPYNLVTSEPMPFLDGGTGGFHEIQTSYKHIQTIMRNLSYAAILSEKNIEIHPTKPYAATNDSSETRGWLFRWSILIGLVPEALEVQGPIHILCCANFKEMWVLKLKKLYGNFCECVPSFSLITNFG